MKSATREPVRGEYVGRNQRQIADVITRATQGGKWEVECVAPREGKGVIASAIIEWDNINNRWDRTGQ